MKDRLLSLFFPPRCAACGELLPFAGFSADRENSALCKNCLALWNSEKLSGCGACGQAVSVCGCMTDAMQRAHCSDFRKSVYYLQGKSAQPQNRILYRIKKAPNRRATAFLAEELLPAVREWKAAGENLVLVYLPRSRRAALQTGTDQAKKLAEELAERAELPLLPALRRRRGSNRLQKKLTPQERIRNAKEAYYLTPKTDLRGFCVILVDDIVTTGAGMAVGTRLLLQAGAMRVHALALASDDRNQNATLRQPQFRI